MPDPVRLTIRRLVHGGQGLAVLPDGKKVFVWNALPGETVEARIFKNKRSYAEAIAEIIIDSSPQRLAPREDNFLATSPWQIIGFDAENRAKRQIVLDVFAQEGINSPEIPPTISDNEQWYYRNKMEYSFWGDDNGVHLALYRRGSHAKEIVTGSVLARPVIDAAATAVLNQLQALGVRAGDLKTVVVRCDQTGNAVAALFVKPRHFPSLELPDGVQGMRVYHSNPKSPASVATELLQEIGDPELTDVLAGNTLRYDVDSFFQVNLPVFELALQRIAGLQAATEIVDLYAGVGSIGLSVASQAVTLVELDVATAAMAAINAEASDLKTEVVETSTERSLEYIVADKPVIVDPPRSGLHSKVVDRLLDVGPPTITYLSCNPITQARDLALLQSKYQVQTAEVYNFFPRTPHIESLVQLHQRPS